MILRLRQFSSLVFLSMALLAIAGALPASAEQHSSVTAPHLTVSVLVPPAELYPGQSFTAGLDFKMEDGWHVYWINAGDSGEPPAITWKLPAGITAGAMQYPPPKSLPLGPLMDFGYEGEVVFPIPINVAADFHPTQSLAPLSAHVTWLVCREVCIPGKADLAFTRSALAAAPASPQNDAAAQQLIAQFQARLPQPLPSADTATFSQTPKGFSLRVTTGSKQSGAQFFPLDQTVIANAAPQPAQAISNGVQLTLTKDENLQAPPQKLHGLLELPDGTAYEIHASPGAFDITATAVVPPGGFSSILGAVGLAFIGGILLNLMPCVFPVLFIKGLALVQSSQHERHKLRAHGWVYTLGILVSFWAVVAVLVILRAAGRQLGWGFQFQSPTFLALMAMLLFFLGLALAGQFEIGLSLTSAGGSLAQKQGYAGSFFTGVLAMIVATPCTAPFMGAAIGYALSHSAWVSFAIFSALALGLAVPYLALAYFPAWARVLPKPGAWMEVLKQAVSIPIFATVIWLVWVFTQLAGTTALMGLLGAFLLLAIAGWFLGRWPGKAAVTTIAAVVLIAAIAAPVWSVRAFGVSAQSAQATGNQPPATGSRWQAFTPALVAQSRAQGKPVFIDFTASWCLSCQVNERLILNNASVQQRLHDSGAVLIRADWTNQDADITQTLASLGRSGVPTYALYPADPTAPAHVLPEVLTPGIVISALDSLPNSNRQSASVSRPIAH
ncbi:MAG TPA: protein-disulfide reductase DsbD domain-containing protein [Acidobacteriaceae bacterium]|jgi:thiol:disulfide interchange protein DsbD|nr:protein-disulfide reductase DsbD domain-containing protein [Acidobacteriaceae bacterium]